MTRIFFGVIKGGKVVFNKITEFSSYLAGLEGKDVEIIVRKIRKDRSNPQNRYYWGVVINLLCECTGYSDAEMHDALKMLFLRVDDRKIPTLRSTADLTTVEFEEYLDKVRMWAAEELSCIIPLPNEVDLIGG